MSPTATPDAPASLPASAPVITAFPFETAVPAGTKVGTTPGGVTIKTSGVPETAPKEDTDFRAAGKKYLEGLQAGERTVAEEIVAKTTVERDAKDAEAAAAAEAPEEPVVAKPGELAWDEKAHRWRDEKGHFVKTDEPPPTEEELAAAAAPEGEETPAAEPFTLRGLQERGEDDIEIEVTDPQVRERLERLRNDGLRRQQFDDAMKGVAAREAELTAVEEALTIDPVGFALNQMTIARQLEVARALLLEHFDSLQPDIAHILDDPVTRANNRVALRDRMVQSRDQMNDHRARMTHAMACMDAARAMVPDGTDDATVEQYLADAEQDLIRAAKAGRPVAPDTVASLLQHRAALYGFESEPVETAPSRNGNGSRRPPTPGTARPLSAAAQAIAERKKQEARETQQRVKRTQIARRSAASVTPPGVGAATVEQPVIPDGADIREVSKILRKRGVANTWTPA